MEVEVVPVTEAIMEVTVVIVLVITVAITVVITVVITEVITEAIMEGMEVFELPIERAAMVEVLAVTHGTLTPGSIHIITI